MTSLSERQTLVGWIKEASQAGARLIKVCKVVNISLRTYRRWYQGGEVQSDARPTAKRPPPLNKLSEAERDHIVETCNLPEYASLPPSQIVPKLLDQGIYLASESTFYRVLNEQDMGHRRGRAVKPYKHARPTTYQASKPNEVYCWDITYLPSLVRGQFFYLYLFEDIFSRKIVGAEVYETESGDHAKHLFGRVLISEKHTGQPLVLHSDNGAPMKSQTFRAKLDELGITASHSRPRVSDDNPFAESLFRTLKYCPQWPSSGFASLADARAWVEKFVQWYNHEHQHSKLNFVTPQQRHTGQDKLLLDNRKRVLEQARSANPERWGSRSVRNCEPVGSVWLNPEKEDIAKAA